MINNSDNLYKRLCELTPCGSQTLSKMPNRYVEGIYPKVVKSGKAGKVKDVDGREYIDLIAGLGCISVGYADDYINECVKTQLTQGVSFSLPTQIEGELSEQLNKLVGWTEMWKYGKNGTDGTVMAVRAARAYTGRNKILTLGYNGCADVFECQGTRDAGVPKILKSLNTRGEYNNLESFIPLNTKEYACVLMEPMVYDFPHYDFLEEIRKACNETGTLLIFDEVVNGGRFEGFTSSNYFKICPDLIVLSKGLANGFPLCAVGGTRRIMSTFVRDDFFASGTFGGETVSIAAALATLAKLNDNIPKLVYNGSRIKEAFNKLPWPKGTECRGYPTRLTFDFPTKAHKAVFMQEMCLRGVLTGYSNFVMCNHSDEDITQIINAIFDTFQYMTLHWTHPQEILKGAMPSEVVRNR